MPVGPAARELALAYLAQHHVLTLATHGDDGPWAAAVFYASEAFTLFFLSSPRSRHAQHLAARPHAAGAIHEDNCAWPAIKGVQFEGTVARLEGAEQEAAERCYLAKFPFVPGAADRDLQRALARVAWFKLMPVRLYYLDNSFGFGHRTRVLPEEEAESK